MTERRINYQDGRIGYQHGSKPNGSKPPFDLDKWLQELDPGGWMNEDKPDDDDETRNVALSLGVECPFKRPERLSRDYVSLETVFQNAVEYLEKNDILSDLIVTLEPTFLFRPDNLIDDIIEHTLSGGHDTVVAAIRESGSLWKEEVNNYERIDSGDGPRDYKENILIGLRGVCCVTHPVFLRNERIFGNKVGLYELDDQLCRIEIRDTVISIDQSLIRSISNQMQKGKESHDN